MAEHDPGPWKFDGPPRNIIVWSSPVRRVCFMTSDGNATGNAQLIAAAPLLLEALQALVRNGQKQGWNDKYEIDMGNARLAISLAEGRSNA